MEAPEAHQADLTRRAHWPLFGALLVALFAGACDGDGDNDMPPPAAAEDSPIGESNAPSADRPADDPTQDTRADDLPGLIVEGLNGQDPAELSSRWLAIVDLFRLESRTPGTGDARVKLRQYDSPFSFDRHIDFYARTLDTCQIRDPADEDDSSPAQGISGGAALVINTPAGPWYSLAANQSESEGVLYQTDNNLPGALPEGATLSIPGDVFPSVAAYPLVEAEAPVRLSPDLGEPLTVDSTYTWVPADSGGELDLDFILRDENGAFERFAAVCRTVDDGRFSLPAGMLELIAATGDRLNLRYTRPVRRVSYVDGVVIFQNIEVAE